MTRPSVRRLVAENTMAQMTAMAVSLGFGLVTAGILSRHLGVDRFGKFHYLFAFYYFFLALNDFGINTVVVREISKNKHRSGEILGSIFLFKLALSLFSLLAAWTVVLRMGFEGDLRRGLLIYGFILPLMALQLPAVVYQVHLKLARLSVLSLINKGIAFIFILTAVWFGFGITGLAIALILSETFYSLLLFRDARSLIEPVWKWNSRVLRAILCSGIPIGLTGLLVAVINRSSFILLERLSDLHQLGLFSAAVKVTSLAEALPLMLMGTLYPLMTYYAVEDPARLRALYRKGLLLLTLLGIALAALVSLLSPQIVRVVFGRSYIPAFPILTTLIWATAFIYPALCGGNLLISLGRERVSLVIILIAAILNVSLNLRMIPLWGALGAARAMTVTYGVVLVFTLIASHSALQQHGRTKTVPARGFPWTLWAPPGA